MSTLLLRGPIFTGEEFIDSGFVLIDPAKGAIIDVGRGQADDPKAARTIEVPGSTILPGLIDAHVHFFGSRRYDMTEWVTTPETLVALRSVADARRLLRAGFTAVRDLGSKVGVYLRKAVEERMFEGPRVVSASKSLSQTGGDDDLTILPLDISKQLSYSYYCDGPWECRRAVRKVIRDGADLVKVYASGSMAQGTHVRRQFTLEELSAIADEAHSAGMKVASHSYGEDALRNSVDAGVDSIEHGIGLTPEIAKQMEKKQIFYIPTLTPYLAKAATASGEHLRLVQRHLKQDMELVKQFNLKLVVGSDFVGCDTEPHGENYREIVNVAKVFGNMQALVAATSRAADCLGLEKAGRVKVGYDADILIVKGNPMENSECLSPSNVLYVMRRGQLYTVNG